MTSSVVRRTIVLGAGGHAKVVLEATRAMGGYEVVGLLDANARHPKVLGVPVLGGDDLLASLWSEGVSTAFIALGTNRTRDRLGEILCAKGFALPPVIHPTAVVSPSARVDGGAVIMARAVVGTCARIGMLAIVNTGSIVEHDNVIGRAAHVAPGVSLAGTVKIGDRTLVGVGSSIRPRVTVGADVVIGAGSAVVSDIADGVVIGGTPARPIGKLGGKL